MNASPARKLLPLVPEKRMHAAEYLLLLLLKRVAGCSDVLRAHGVNDATLRHGHDGNQVSPHE